jgi:fructosamine-3-kinase
MNDEVYRAVEDLLKQHLCKTVKVIDAKLLGGGCINNAVKLLTSAGEFFLKWNDSCIDDMFLREAEGLQELRKATDGNLIIPKVIGANKVDQTPGFLLQEYLSPGNASEYDDEKLGRGLAHIHKFVNTQFGFYNNNYCGASPQKNDWTTDWVEFYRDKRLRYLLTLIQNTRPFSSGEIKLMDKLLDRIPKLIPNHSTPVLIHGDLWSGNYMITNHGPALIDPAAYYADREMEFAIITMFGGFSSRFFAAYNEVNSLDPEWRSRNELYQLYHVLNHYYLFGGAYGQQALAIVKRFVV